MEIEKLFEKYKEENGNLIEYIVQTVNLKHENGDWDLGVSDESDKLVYVLMYEYSSSIEKLTKSKITATQVIQKLSDQMKKFRLGDYKLGEDDNVTYGSNSVTSIDYKKNCRINGDFGAHAIDFKDIDGEIKTAVVLFDDRQVAVIDGVEYKLSGVDLTDLADIRHTTFHEWTHIMEKNLVKASELIREDVVRENGESRYINALLGPDLSKQEYEDYFTNIDSLLKSNEEILFGGISTIELNDKKSPDRRIMHNQISEGATELISRMVLETIGEKVKHPDRYSEQVRIVRDIFSANGMPESIATYFNSPHKVITSLEDKRVQDKDMLHYISEYINSQSLARMIFNRVRIDQDGNVKPSLLEKLRVLFSRKEAKVLPEVTTLAGREEKKNKFLESIEVSPEQLEENRKEQESMKDLKVEEQKNMPEDPNKNPQGPDFE